MKTIMWSGFWLIALLFTISGISSCAQSEAPPRAYRNFANAYTYKESRPELAKLMADGKLTVYESGTVLKIHENTMKARADKQEEAARMVDRKAANDAMKKFK